jgi:phage terminase Nu1 subunit (DNA packaging protein)
MDAKLFDISTPQPPPEPKSKKPHKPHRIVVREQLKHAEALVAKARAAQRKSARDRAAIVGRVILNSLRDDPELRTRIIDLLKTKITSQAERAELEDILSE